MELTVSLPVFIADLILLAVISYAVFYGLKRVNRYEGALSRFITITTLSLLLAFIGRVIDVVDDFIGNQSVLFYIEETLYFFSIIGVTYGVINYIGNVEKRIFPVPSGEAFGGELVPGGFMYLGDNLGGILEFLKKAEIPAMVVTRSPWRYEGAPENVRTLWVTQAAENGVGPTKLHVILDGAVKFFRSGGKLVVMDCLEVLVLYNDFQSVFRFLSTLKDYAIETGSTVLLLVDESTIDERQMSLLRREFTPVKSLRELLRTSP